MKVNNLTAVALCDVMSKKQVMEITGISLSRIKRLLKGFTPIAFNNAELDKEFIKKLGWKICTCCGIRLIPKQPVNGQILTRLCRFCWQMQDTDIEEHVVTIAY